MNKNVAISALTPVGKTALANQILGAVIEPPKTRWAPGSLLSAAFLAVDPGLIAILSPSFLFLVSYASAADAAELMGDIETRIHDKTGEAFPVALSLTALPGPSRSRVLAPAVGSGVSIVDPAFNGAFPAPVATLAASVLLPTRPSFTASSFAGRVDSFFQDREVPEDYLLVMDQFNGTVKVLASTDGSSVLMPTVAHIEEITGQIMGREIIAVFDLTVPSSDPVDSGNGPVWG